MYFSDIVAGIGGSYNFEPSAKYIYVINKSDFKIVFTMNHASIIIGDIVKDFNLNEFGKFNFTLIKSNSTDDDDMMTMSLGNEDLVKLKASKMSSYKDLFEKLKNGFTDYTTCSPEYQLQNVESELGINFSELKESTKRKIIFVYKNRFQSLIDNSFIDDDASILFFLEEHTGQTDRGETLKKNFKIENLSVGGLAKSGFSMVKGIFGAGAKRVLDSTLDASIYGVSILILTDTNVIISTQDRSNSYDIDDALIELRSQQDETFAGIIDIYDDLGNKLLDNINPDDWSVFKTKLKKIKKGSYEKKQNLTIAAPATEISSHQGIVNDIELKKLKSLLDEGILSEEEFSAKKCEILGIKPHVYTEQHKPKQVDVPPVPPIPENTKSEKPKKKQKTWVKVLKWIGIIYLSILAIQFIFGLIAVTL